MRFSILLTVLILAFFMTPAYSIPMPSTIFQQKSLPSPNFEKKDEPHARQRRWGGYGGYGGYGMGGYGMGGYGMGGYGGMGWRGGYGGCGWG